MNCGYGKGFNVKQMIEDVKKVSGVNFTVKNKDRRLGDALGLVARAVLCRSLFKWSPKDNDLSIIVKHVFNWEKKLKRD